MTVTYSFSVPFVHGQNRPRIAKAGRKVWLHKPASDREREAVIADAYREAGGTMAPDGMPVAVTIRTRRGVRSDMRKRDGDAQVDVEKPDADNIAKLVLDALNGVAYHDDSQVSVLLVIKDTRLRGATAETWITTSWEEPNGEHADED